MVKYKTIRTYGANIGDTDYIALVHEFIYMRIHFDCWTTSPVFFFFGFFFFFFFFSFFFVFFFVVFL